MPDTQELEEQDLSETLARFRGMLIRSRWWTATSVFIVAIGTMVCLSYLPNRYTSEATLLIIQEQVPERHVVPTTTTDINNVLGSMAADVLSRTRLLPIIHDFDLYARQKATAAPEELVDLMRQEIKMAPVQKTSWSIVDW